jgi:rhamnulose-1-phosphate aldolase/alcohol dehydrogenase
MSNPTVQELLERSNRLGADPTTTNYAGGNTSAKGSATDPVTGGPVELLWVKGSGGDLGTLTEPGLAVLRLDRLRALTGVYPGVEREDEMVAAFDYCRHGRGGAAPSIDTAMHGLVEAAHVDHLHPDAGIAVATAADGEELTEEIFGDRVVWVPWRRPGFQLGLDIAAVARANPQAVGVVLGGHGITAWGATSAECERNSMEIIRAAQAFIDARAEGAAHPFGEVRPGFAALPEAQRRARAAALAPVVRGLASTDRRQVGHFTDTGAVLDFLAREKLAPLAALGTSCPDHFLRTKVRPLVLDLPADAPLEQAAARLRELHHRLPRGLPRLLRAARHAGLAGDARRGPGDRAGPRRGMFSFGATKQTARVAGEFLRQRDQRDARGGDGVDLRADPGVGEVPHRVLGAGGGQAGPDARAQPLAGRIALVTGAASGIGRATAERLAAEGACVVLADLDAEKAAAAAAEIGSTDVAVGVGADVSDEDAVQAAVDAVVLAFGGVDLVVNNAGLSISKPLLETTVRDWDLQHDVMAKGSFLVSRAAAQAMIDQGSGGDLSYDIVYISSKNSLFAGPNNIAYGATKADQAHQVRLLAAELGPHGIRVNGINPDGVVRGSGIFAGGWGAKRAEVYGVPEEELGAYYAKRTLLGREVLPEHVAAAVVALTAGDLSQTTGLHVPVDSGVAAAFLR